MKNHGTRRLFPFIILSAFFHSIFLSFPFTWETPGRGEKNQEGFVCLLTAGHERLFSAETSRDQVRKTKNNVEEQINKDKRTGKSMRNPSRSGRLLKRYSVKSKRVGSLVKCPRVQKRKSGLEMYFAENVKKKSSPRLVKNGAKIKGLAACDTSKSLEPARQVSSGEPQPSSGRAVSAKAVPFTPAASSSAVLPGASSSGRGKTRAYLVIVKNIIERHKIYPFNARRFGRQGRVKLSFTIMPDGEVKDIRIIKGCRFDDLNRAAKKSIAISSPLPAPPASLKAPLPVVLELAFQII